jgi:PAS domain S-box-containing protein
MKPQESPALQAARRTMLLIACCWTAVLLLFGVFEYENHKSQAVEMARVNAVSSFQKDINYREWVALRGGVYVPVTPKTPPNPFLADWPERDVTTPSGKKLTLVNPAYMTRQVHQSFKAVHGVTGHLTSLKPINPANAADEWETAMLKTFENGTPEAWSVENVEGEPMLRFMRPLVADKTCLKCHSAQGYQEGDIRGGISVAVPLKPYFEATTEGLRTAWLWGGGVWALGMLGLMNSYRRMRSMIQQREQDAEHLREAQETLRQLYDSMSEGMAVHEILCDAKGQPCDYRFLQVNPAFERLTGLKAAAITGKTVREVLPGVDREWIERYGRVALTGKPCEFEDYAPDLKRYFHISAFSPRQGQFAVTFSDITERMKTEVALAESRAAALNIMEDALAARDHAEKSRAGLEREVEERKRMEMALQRLATAIEQSAETIVITDAEATILYANPAFEKITGYTRAEALGQNPRILKSGKHDAAFYRQLWDTLSRGEVWHGHFINKKKDGTLIEEEATISPVRDPDGRIVNYVAVKRDVTQQVAMEVQLRESQKLESIGTLASGVAHEINNPIYGIMNYAQLISDRLPADSPLRKFSMEIIRETDRVALIVRNLLAFSRKGQQIHQPANPASIINDTLSLMRTVMRHDQITLDVDVPADLPKVNCHSQQIQQVVMNLLTNARDALNERYPEYHEDKIIRLAAQQFQKDGQRWVRLVVEDHGMGITPEVGGHVFDPFFTTKLGRGGTGLGLSISHGIVKDHGGVLRFETEAGRYTRFLVDLPVIKEGESL